MKRQYLLSAAFIGLTFVTAMGTSVLAQSPSSGTGQTSSSPSPSSPSTTTPSPSTPAASTPSSSSPSSSTTPTTSDANRGTATDGQRTTQTTNPSNAPAPSTSPSASQATPTNSSASQTQPTAPSASGSNNATNNATPSSPATNNAAAPAQAQPSSAANNATPTGNTNINVNLNDTQRTRVSETFSRLNVRPISNVNFSVSIGTVVPRDVRLETLPTEIVEIVPEYRGYSYFAVRDEIVIVEPSTQKIVTILPRGGSTTTQAPVQTERKSVSTETRSKARFSDSDRDVVRKHVKSRSERSQSDRDSRTVGSRVTTSVRVGERVPDTVEIHTFDDDDYRVAPALRQYRYIQHENRAYIVDPGERRIIEEID